MRGKYLVFFIALNIIIASGAVCYAGIFTVPEWIEKSCVFVMKNEKAEGTGFLIGVQEGKFTFCYFVTAKHVIEPALAGSNDLLLRLNKKGEDCAEIVRFPLFMFDNRPWMEHGNSAVDLAVAPLAIFSKVSQYDVVFRIVDSETDEIFACESFINKYKVGPGDQAFTLGLVPYLFIRDTKNIIMTRSGTVSMVGKSELSLPGGKQRAHFLDCPAFGGQSGGPAFVLLERNEAGAMIAGWRIALMGIVTEFVPSPLRAAEIALGEEERRNTALLLMENTGICKVVPVDYLIEILFSEKQKDWRRQIAKKREESRNE